MYSHSSPCNLRISKYVLIWFGYILWKPEAQLVNISICPCSVLWVAAQTLIFIILNSLNSHKSVFNSKRKYWQLQMAVIENRRLSWTEELNQLECYLIKFSKSQGREIIAFQGLPVLLSLETFICSIKLYDQSQAFVIKTRSWPERQTSVELESLFPLVEL